MYINYMKTITQTYTNTYQINRSKFIAYLTPINEFKSLQKKLKLENPKANHIVYALRELNEYEQIVENSSDDGEPKGCAGVPTLNVLRGREIINVAVLIVRYFGGIKLGTGGMARAYGSATKEVIDIALLCKYQKIVEYKFDTSYSQVDKTLYLLKQLNITSFERDFGIDGVGWIVRGDEVSLEKLKGIV
ncbi:MAG: YigZ family protein [Sulfurovum sp.]